MAVWSLKLLTTKCIIDSLKVYSTGDASHIVLKDTTIFNVLRELHTDDLIKVLPKVENMTISDALITHPNFIMIPCEQIKKQANGRKMNTRRQLRVIVILISDCTYQINIRLDKASDDETAHFREFTIIWNRFYNLYILSNADASNSKRVRFDDSWIPKSIFEKKPTRISAEVWNEKTSKEFLPLITGTVFL